MDVARQDQSKKKKKLKPCPLWKVKPCKLCIVYRNVFKKYEYVCLMYYNRVLVLRQQFFSLRFWSSEIVYANTYVCASYTQAQWPERINCSYNSEQWTAPAVIWSLTFLLLFLLREFYMHIPLLSIHVGG